MEERPTKKQKELLSFIDGFIKGNGYGPSYREIMRALDYKSVSTVAVHVDGLIARGYLRKVTHSARSLEIVGRDLGALAPTTTPIDPVERILIAKIKALSDSDSDETSTADRKTLIEALRILGFNESHDKYT